MKEVYYLLLIFVVLPTTCLSQNLNTSLSYIDNKIDTKLSRRDKTQIVEAVLSKFDFLNRKLRDGESKENVCLSTENISLNSAPKVYGIYFALVNFQVVQEKSKTGFTYYAFQKFKVEGSKVYVSFAEIYVDSGFRERYPGGSGSPDVTTGVIYEFKNVTGKWQGHVISGYQQMS